MSSHRNETKVRERQPYRRQEASKAEPMRNIQWSECTLAKQQKPSQMAFPETNAFQHSVTDVLSIHKSVRMTANSLKARLPFVKAIHWLWMPDRQIFVLKRVISSFFWQKMRWDAIWRNGSDQFALTFLLKACQSRPA